MEQLSESEQSELKRLRAGRLTPDECQRICHNLHEVGGELPVTPEQFSYGCEAYQVYLFDYSPSVKARAWSFVWGILIGFSLGVIPSLVRWLLKRQ